MPIFMRVYIVLHISKGIFGWSSKEKLFLLVPPSAKMQWFVLSLWVTPQLRGCPSGKTRTRASFTEILENYISEESLITANYDEILI